jgi:hypothetical protein
MRHYSKKAPPKFTKAELMEKISESLGIIFPGKPESALLWALNFFTAWDLEAMYAELVEKKRKLSKNKLYRNAGVEEPDEDDV